MDNLVDILSKALLEKELWLVTAESCTGGMISVAMTERAGASAIFEGGFVTYSNAAKQKHLDVSPNILNNYGAVSMQCADAMAIGALKNSNADIAVSITGIAGPGGGSDEKPVGLVYIGIVVMGREPDVTECHFSGTRADVRKQACEKALHLLIETTHTI
ncbi:MAG: damage-inducible protein CinA [Alphaproteobacteria bacterium]|nr:MAG: damage-inducible protein CinA [Alphaproteobacteria bacterium]